MSSVSHWYWFVLQFLGVAKDNSLDDPANVIIWPDAQQDALWTAPALGTQIGAPVDWGPEHIVDTIGVEDERGIGDVILAGSLWQGQTLLQNTKDSLCHGLGAPGLEWSSFPESQMVDDVLIGVPALLPHRLQLILVAICKDIAGTNRKKIQLVTASNEILKNRKKKKTKFCGNFAEKG